ncbi:hypothetical protein BV25DRAFT_1872634 [Artomyces pyxidatus]|uniref:Uncharacterized protein n=1 Tax=Artomyces pyxidatus TaxID=48021 RepID=A0ACB8SKR2_9AGAM|nr:hypothetical protein BV25DRAFT_1872634 [Artomyces pyxidatus]
MQAANHGCSVCGRLFRTQAARLSHQQQSSRCRSVLVQRNAAPAAPLQNYLDSSDLEDDPPQHDDDDGAPFVNNDVADIFNASEPPSPHARASTPPPDNLQDDNGPNGEQRARAELLQTSEPATIRNVYHPFAHRMDWDVAQWAKELGPSQNAFTKLLAVPGVIEKLGLSYKDSRSLNQTIDSLPDCAHWQSSTFSIKDEAGVATEHVLHFRDPLESIKMLYSNPAFLEHMSYAPEEHFSDESMQHRIFSEMHTGNWWSRIQSRLPPGATVVPTIISSDKTELNVFNGGETAYPLYLTIGNLSRGIRRKPSLHAQVLVSYLPTPDLTGHSDSNERILRARVFHAAMEHIFAPLRDHARDGVELTSGDGAVRLCFPVIACYVADYPEQSLVTCTRTGSRSTLRTLRRAATLTTATRRENVLKDAGLTHVPEPFWANHPHCDIHHAITPDILHQLYQGMVAHLIAWVTVVVGEAELDARFKRLPETHGTRLFKKGISSLSRVSGGEHREICKQLLGCLVGKAPAGAVRAARAMLDFLHIAQYKSHTDETFAYLQTALDEFHADKDIFLQLSARAGGNFNLPKLHSLQHYIDSIREFGATDNYNTETTERMHIDFAKEAYRATNKKDYIEQMTWWLQRREKVAMFAVHVRWRLQEMNAGPRPSRIKPAKRLGRIRPAKPAPLPTRPGLSLAKAPTVRNISLSSLPQNYQATLFVPALQMFLARHYNPAELRPASLRRLADNIPITFPNIDIWHRIKFKIANLQVDDAPDYACAAVAEPGRFDTVLVNEDGAAETGVTGLRVGRLRLVFQLPIRFQQTLSAQHRNTPAPGHLAYIEWFSRFTDKDDDHRMYPVSHPRQPDASTVEIVEVDSIHRNCQLMPKFGARVDRAWTSENVLDRCLHFFVNNFLDNHAYQSIW